MKKRSLVLTVLSVGSVATVFAFSAINNIRNQNARQSVVIPESYTFNAPIEEPVSSPVVIEEEPEIVPDAVVEEPEIVEEISYIMPVSGEIIGEFSDTVPVFQETYGDYRTHMGIDIEASENTPVFSIDDGVVTKSYMDLEEGYVVEIEHKSGVTGVYKNMSDKDAILEGKVVSKGEQIGKISENGIFESHMPTHLHFELLEDNVEINPLEKINILK